MVHPRQSTPTKLPDDTQSSSFDGDLEWIMQSFVERVGADAGALGLTTSQGESTVPLVKIGNISAFEEWLISYSDGAVSEQTSWRESSKSGSRALSLKFNAGYDNQIIVKALFEQSSKTEKSAANYMAERLRPVLAGYFRLWAAHRADRRRIRGLESALHASGIGVFVLDGAANLLFANQQGQRLLATSDGLRRKGRSIAASSLPDAVRFHVAVDHLLNMHHDSYLADRSSPLLTLRRTEGKRPLTVAILPTEDYPMEPTDPAAIIYAIDPDGDLGSLIRPLCQLYQLSPMETRLVIALLDGQAIKQAAATLCVSIQTARSYLKQIFVKTGTNRQADLVRVMLSSFTQISKIPSPLTDI